MGLLGTIGQLSRSESTAALLGIAAIACFMVWSFLRTLLFSPPTPDPWDGQVGSLDEDECFQVCHRCLGEHHSSLHFCPHCGALVGACTSLMPPLYLYSIGDVFRAGVESSRKHSVLSKTGYFFAAFVAYGLVAPLFFLLPVYWFKLLRNVSTAQNPTDVDL